MAGLSLVSGSSIVWIRLWHNLLSLLGAVALLCLFWTRAGKIGIFCLLPVVSSTYYLKQSCVISTDNIALAFVGIALWSFFAKKPDPRLAIIGVISALVSIYMRQISAWIFAPIAFTALFCFREKKNRLSGYVWFFGTVLGICLLGYMFFCWNGLVPPRFQSSVAGKSLSGVVYALCLIAMFAPFFFEKEKILPKNNELRETVSAAIIGAAIFLAAPSTFSVEQGRWGGLLWSIAKQSPYFADRAIILLPLTICGVIFIQRIFKTLIRKDLQVAIIWLCALVAWLASSIPNGQVFHRYFEGPALVLLGIAGTLVSHKEQNLKRKIASLCILFFVGALLALYFTDNAFESGSIFKVPLFQR